MTNTIKIFHFTTNLSGGGAETQMLLLASGLQVSKYDQVVVYYKAEASFPFDYYSGIKFISFKNFWDSFQNVKNDDIIFHIWIPDVFTYINPFFFRKYANRTLVGVRNRYSLNSLKRIYQALCFLLNSNFVSNTPLDIHSDIYKRLFGSNFNYIPNAIKYDIDGIEGVYKKPDQFLFVGRLVEQKGILDLIGAMNSLENEDASLEILGQGPLEDTIKVLLKDNTKITLRGFSQNPKKYFQDHKFLVLPSYYEGMPNVAFEALSQNCLLILSDIPQNRLWFSDKEVFYFEPGNTSQLKSALLHVLKMSLSKRVEMVQLAKRKLNKLTVDNYVKSYKNLYSNIINENH